MSEFILDPRLEADTGFLADWPLSRVLLMNDTRFPWLILVPRINAVELFELDSETLNAAMAEAVRAGERLKAFCKPDKINIASLGNVVPQLHIHVVARTKQDAAWPGPVWGSGLAKPYEKQAFARLIADLQGALA